jgi:glycosyltransferase involved in cell wall biosynthesis
MKVSINFLSYNHASFVGAALRSALAQDYPEYELIVHDDGSTDGTAEIIENILATEVPAHVHVIIAGDGKNHGMVESFNRTLKVATGEVIMHIAGDDISHPNRLAKSVEVFQKHPDVMLVVSEVQRIDKKGNLLTHPNYESEDKFYSYTEKPRHIYAKAFILGAAAAYRSRLVKEFEPIKRGFCHAEDNIYWVRALLLGRIYYIAEPLLYYRLHENNVSENGWKWMNGVSSDLKIAHLEFARKHSLNILQWEIDIRHALQKGFIDELKAAQSLKTAKLDAMRWALLVASLNVASWSVWFRLASENIKWGGIKVTTSMFKLRISERYRRRYWSRHIEWATKHFKP